MAEGRKKDRKIKVVLAMVMSVDGKTTKWGDPEIYKWTSKEDQDYFFSLIEKHNAIIMGRKTYEAARALIKLSPYKLRVVLTRSPKSYKDFAVAGQLEFRGDSVEEIIENLRKRGYREALLVGGEHVNALFLQAGLVSEVWISVEPVIFGVGNGLAGNIEMDIRMRLKNVTILNERGTLLLKYEVL